MAYRLFFVFALFAFSTTALAERDLSAESYVDAIGKKYITALTNPASSYAKRSDKFDEALRNHFNMNRMGKLALGRYWRQLDESKREEYISAFNNFIKASYTIRFSEYPTASYQIVASKVLKGDDVLVATMIKSEKLNNPVRIDWRLSKKSGEFKVTDVIIEGVSMIVSQRSEFSSIIQKNGGNISALIDLLKEKAQTVNG